MTNTTIVWMDNYLGSLLVYRTESECGGIARPIRLDVKTAEHYISLTQQVISMEQALRELPYAYEDEE